VTSVLINLKTNLTEYVSFPGAVSTSTYGIVQISDTLYTICGGFDFAPKNNASIITYNGTEYGQALGQAFLVNYDTSTNTFFNWINFVHPVNNTVDHWHTHFEGISYNASTNLYTLVADNLKFIDVNFFEDVVGSFVQIRCNFEDPINPLFPCEQAWQDFHYPGFNGGLSANSVAGYHAVGLNVNPRTSSFLPFSATINDTAFNPLNATCPFYYDQGQCLVYAKANQTLYFNGCNEFCTGNQTLSVNFTGRVVNLESDGSCGGCFTGKVKIPILGSNADNPSLVIVSEGCVGTCTGKQFCLSYVHY
jgi:hypothetical protein